jgi:hypothetical protein
MTGTTASIPAEWYRVGCLPPVCARHGRPATRRLKRTFYTRTPTWVYLLIVISVLVAAIVALAVRKSAPGSLPGCDQCVAERRRFVWSAVGGWLLGLGLLVLAGVADNGPAAILGLLVLLVALVWTFCGDQIRVRGSLRKDLLWVDLKGVAPEFDAQLRPALGLPQHGHPSLPTNVGGPVAPTSSSVAPMSARNILPGA